jgi:hypothetical protein
VGAPSRPQGRAGADGMVGQRLPGGQRPTEVDGREEDSECGGGGGGPWVP